MLFRYATKMIAITHHEHASEKLALLEEIKTYKGRDEVPEHLMLFGMKRSKSQSFLLRKEIPYSQVKCYELTL